MGEFGVVLMVGGNIPGVTRTVSIDIYDKVQAINYSGANATALVLLGISFAVLSVVYALNRRGLARRGRWGGPKRQGGCNEGNLQRDRRPWVLSCVCCFLPCYRV